MVKKFLIKNNQLNDKISLADFSKISLKSPFGETSVSFKFPLLFLPANVHGYLFVRSQDKKDIRSFILTTSALVIKVMKGYFIKILFFSLSFSARKKKWYLPNLLELDLHFSKRLNILLPPAISFRLFKRRVYFFSYSKPLLLEFIRFLRAFRQPNPYSAKGIRLMAEKIVRKQGKGRQR